MGSSRTRGDQGVCRFAPLEMIFHQEGCGLGSLNSSAAPYGFLSRSWMALAILIRVIAERRLNIPTPGYCPPGLVFILSNAVPVTSINCASDSAAVA